MDNQTVFAMPFDQRGTRRSEAIAQCPYHVTIVLTHPSQPLPTTLALTTAYYPRAPATSVRALPPSLQLVSTPPLSRLT